MKSHATSNANENKVLSTNQRVGRLKGVACSIAVAIGLFLLLPASVNANACSSTGTGNWGTAGTWTSCGATTPQPGDTVTINNGHTVTLDTTATVTTLTVGGGTSGTLIFENATSRTLTVSGNVIVNAGATFITQAAGALTHAVSIGGNLTNGGTFDMSRGGTTLVADVTFNGAANQSVSGAGGTTRFNNITINNTGAANNNIVEVSSSNFSAASGFLTLTQGILKVSGSFTFSNAFFSAAAYTVNSNAGIWINNPNVTVTGQAGDPTLSGLLRLTQGTYNVGTVADNDLIYATGSTIDIQGGALSVAGALQGTTVSASGTTNTTTYNQSGGTVTVATVNVTSDVTTGGKSRGSFDIHAAGSSFTMSGGTIVLQTPTNVQDDYLVGATLGSVTGGKLQCGNAGTTGTNPFGISSSTPVFDVTIKSTSSQGTWLLVSSLTVKGDLLIESGVTLDARGHDLAVAGNWTNNGTFTNSGRLVTFNGGSNRDVGGSGTNGFANLTMNGAGITLTAAASVSGTLTLTNGKITTGSNTLTLGSGATSTGASSSSYVIGNLKKTTVPSSFTFDVGTANGYSPVTLTSVSGSGDFTVSATQSTMPGVALTGKALARYWTLTNGGLTSAILSFKYLDADIPGTSTEANYRIFKDTNGTGSGFSFPDNGNDDVTDATNTATTLIAVSTFSNWSLAEPNAPTAVKLMSFTATNNNGEVTLQWQSGYEAHNLGYYVYREQDGKRTQITPSLIAGSALTTGQQTVVNGGLAYTWYDQVGQTADGRQQTAGNSAKPDPNGRVTYWLEDVDLNGTQTLHGPIAPAVVYTDPKGQPQRSALLAEVQQREPASGTVFRGWAGAFAEQQAQLAIPPRPGRKAAPKQREIAGLPGVKIAVSRAGWYRVTRAELLAAGFDAKEVADQLQLYADGVEVPLKLSGDGTLLADSDYLEFYGQGVDSPTEAAQTYYLIVGKTSGQRIGERSAGKPGEPAGPQSYDYTIERKDRWIYYSAFLNGDAENVFGHIVRSAPVNETLPVNHPDLAGGDARLEVSLVGVSLQDHHVLVSVNGQNVGTVDFAGSGHPTGSFNVPASLLVDGDNTVQLSALGGDTDASLVDTMRLTYAHLYVADSNALTISINDAKTTRIGGFTDSHVRAVDITDPHNLMELKPLVTEDKEGYYTADLQVPDASFRNARTLLVFADGAVGHPDSIRSNEASSWWSQTAGADYVIITSHDFVTNVEPLAALRRNQGMIVKVVDVEDLYDEFSFGRHTPQAIHDFLQTTANTWIRKPHYVLLAGDSSFDPKNYLGQGNTDFVPTKLLDTALMETASDDWLADFDGDGLADLALGRLPIRTPADADLMVAKIINYENAVPDPQRGALLVADRDFEASSTAVQSLLPSSLPQQVINRSSADDATIHNRIISSLNQGPRLVNFMGHGGNGTWTGALLLSIYDAPALTNNNRLSVFVMMTCMNGYFQNAYNDSLSEALLRTPGGAVAVWSSSGMTEPGAQKLIDQEFYRQLFGGQSGALLNAPKSDRVMTRQNTASNRFMSNTSSPTLGDAVRTAKHATSDLDVRRTWTLFGDPAMRLR